MKTDDAERTVGQLVIEHPAYANVFEKLGIDYCCGGAITLGEACRRKGLDIGRVFEQLALQEEANSSAAEKAWTYLTLGELCDHIEQTHHAYLRRQLPNLQQLLNKVVARHGSAHPELVQVAHAFAALQQELVPHLLKEERVLFPMIRHLAQTPSPDVLPCGGLEAPVHVMESEHDIAGAELARLRQLTNGYVPPNDACHSYTAMLQGLAELEADLHQHIHKENNFLFPRALELR